MVENNNMKDQLKKMRMKGGFEWLEDQERDKETGRGRNDWSQEWNQDDQWRQDDRWKKVDRWEQRVDDDVDDNTSQMDRRWDPDIEIAPKAKPHGPGQGVGHPSKIQ